MRKIRLFALATAFSAGVALPALAALDTDTVYISPDHYTSASLSEFGGPVERLNVISNRNVDCDHITVHYRDGTAQDVFSGMLYSGERQSIAFPGGARPVADVRLTCRADDDFGARLSLTADVTSYRPAPTYYAVPHFDSDARAAVSLQPIAEPDFGHWANRSIMIAGSGERELNAIALQPVGADARRRLTTTFDDGSSSVITVNDGASLREGEVYRVHVDGHDRSLSGIGLTCQARNNDSVTIKVYDVG